MSDSFERSLEVQAAAEKLAAKVRAETKTTDQFFIEAGIDPTAVRNVFNALKTDEITAEIDREWEEVEQAIQSEASKLRSEVNANLVGPQSKLVKRFRPMV